MSRLIDQLIATEFPGKSQRDLTLETGKWLEANERRDVFLANPDFAQEYEVLKDEIARARRPSYVEEFKGAFGSAFNDLQASGFALGALAADGARRIGIPGAEPIRNKLLELMKEQEAEAAEFQPSVSSYDKITNLEDVGRYATFGLGTVAPSMAQAAVSAGVGALAGSAVGSAAPGPGTVVGAVGGALLGLAEKRLAQKVLSGWLARGIKNESLEVAAKTLTKAEIAAEAKRLAIQYGGQAGLAASSIGQEIGSIYSENPEAPGTAVLYGIPAGLLDIIPEAYIASRFLGAGRRIAEEEVKKATGYFRRFVTEAGKTIPLEASTEAAQTLLEIAAAKSGRGEPAWTFTDDDYKQAVNAGIIGGIGGFAMAPVSAAANPNARVDPSAAMADRGARMLSQQPDAMLGELPDFTEQSNELSNRDLGTVPTAPDIANPLGGIGETEQPDANFDPFQVTRPAYQSAQVFEQNERDPSADRGMLFEEALGGALSVTPQQPLGPPVPKFILRAQEKAEEAARAWESFVAPPRPPLGFGDTPVMPELESIIPPGETAESRTFQQFGNLPPVPPSADIVDAPLANLIGTQVQYQGYTGQLVRDAEGNFMVLPPVRPTAKPFWVEVAGTGKDPSVMGSAVGVVPTEPPNITPKSPEAIGTTGGDRGAAGPSKIPLAPLFPNDLPPVAGLRGDVQGAPSGPLIAQQGFPQPQSPAAVGTPVAAPAPDIVAAPTPTAAAPVVPPVVAPPVLVIAPTGVVTQPTGEQVIAVGDNGVKPLPRESAPNLRRLQVFSQAPTPVAVEAIEGPQPVSPQPVEASAIGPNPMVELVKRVKKVAKKDSNVAVVIVDNATGLAFQRLAYGGPANTVYVDMASRRKGTATGQGSTVSYEADFVNGTEGRPISGSRGVFAEKLPDGTPRYTIYGIGELIKPGKLGNWNLGSVANLAAHPGIAEAAKLGWTENAKVINARAATALSTAQDISQFVEEMAVWRGENAGAKGAKAMLAHIEAWAKADQKRNVGARKPTPQQMADYVELIRGNIDAVADVQAKQTSRISADYIAPTASVIDLFKSTLRALTEGRQVDVAAFEQGLMGAVDSAAKTTGLVISPAGRRKIVAFAASAINGPIDPATIISLLHETGHVVTDGLAEPLRVAFQEAIEQMPWQARHPWPLTSGEGKLGTTDAVREAIRLVGRPEFQRRVKAYSAKVELRDDPDIPKAAQAVENIARATVALSLADQGHPAAKTEQFFDFAFFRSLFGESLPVPAAEQGADVRETRRWLMNPRSLDIRLLANAEPSQLSPEQRAALETLTAEEIAAARRISPAELAEEQMAEHLAQLGWDKSEAKGVVQALVRFVKELWLKMAMAIQTALKGADNLSPALARAYVENRYLQFIHRDSALARDRINDLMTWLGAPATPQQTIPVFPAGPDWDQRMQFIDVATGEIIPTKTGNYTPDSQTREIKLALDRAAQWVAQNPTETTPDTPDLRFTRRAFFAAPFSSTPSITANKQFAQVNLEDELYRTVAADPTIAPLLPQVDGAPIAAEVFATDWLKLPPEQTPAARKAAALASAKQPDPLTGAPIAHQPDITVDALPTTEQKIVDREGKPKVVQITEAQDDAIKQAILSLRDTERRVTAQAARDNEQLEELTREKERQGRTRGEFPAASQYRLSQLSEQVLTRQKIAIRLHAEINALLAKLRPGDIVNVYPGAELLSVPDANATEETIRGGRKYRIPADMTFATAETKAALGAEISRGEAWLKNDDNRLQGQIYGIVSEQVRKLRQIPLNQERSAVSAILRKISGGFIDSLNASGLPSLRAMAKRFAGATAFVGQYRAEAEVHGQRWSAAFGQFARAMGRPADQAFVEELWDPLSRAWNFVDSSERAKLGTPDEGSIFAVLERALKANSGLEVTTDTQRAALRALTMQTIESERFFGQIFDHHPELQVNDAELGTYRRLLTHGLVTGRRGLRREMLDLTLRMNPAWSDTRFIGDGDQRTFFEAAGELYTSDRAAFDERMKALFDGYVTEDFVAPLASNNVATFDVAGSDGEARRASILNVRQAWSEAEGNVTTFAEILHRLEGGTEGQEGLTVGFVLGNLQERFGRLKSIIDKQRAAAARGVETLQRQMLDGREANDLPAQWVSYATMDSTSNLILVHQLAMQAGFGPQALEGAQDTAIGGRRSARGADPIAAGGELSESIRAAKDELTEIQGRMEVLRRDGLSPSQIRAEMGDDDYGIATTATRTMANLDYVETVFRQLHSVTNYLNTDLKTANEVLGFMSTMMLQNPRSGLIQMADLLGGIVDLKASTQTLKLIRSATKTAAAEIGNSVIESFGQQAAFAVPAARRRAAAGSIDSETRVGWREKMEGQGPRSMLATPTGFEGKGSLIARTITRLSRRGRDIIPNLGSPLATESDARLAPKLTAGLFHTITQAAMRANTDAAYDLFADIATRGVGYIQKMPATERAGFVRELELGVRDLGAEELGYFGGFLLNDKAAFESLKAALETQMVGERSVGDFVAKAYRRMEVASRESDAGRGDGSWEVISNSQFVDIIGYTNNQWTLAANFATLPAFMQGPMRPLFIFLTWPYLAMRRAARGFTDAQQRMTWVGANSSVADGLKALFVIAAPATIAGSFAIDWYDKYLLGKRQNLREAPASTAIPIVGAALNPRAFIERWARYGSAGLPSDILNMAVNYDSQRTLSLDSRVVAVSAIQNLFNTLIKTPISQEMNLTYGTFGRPLLQSVGGGGVLQYLQIAQNLLGLDTQDAAINARINTGNYLRAAGRELDLPVRVFTGPSFTPTPVTPYLQQMELAALVNNPTLFREAYRAAVQAERDEGHTEDAEKRVADNFATRHPLRRLFKGAVSEGDYRRMLGAMDGYGATQVRKAVNSYNTFLANWFSKKAYYGKADEGRASVEELIRKATRINSDFDRQADSLLATPGFR